VQASAMANSAVVFLVETNAPIEDVALAIAKDEYPRLDASHHRALLDGWAEMARVSVEGATALPGKLAAMVRLLYDELGFSGNEGDYYDPRNSYLNDVLERRVGIPITMAVVLMAIGRRLDIAIEGVGFPGHFLVRAGGHGGLFLDPFNRGQVLDPSDLLQLAQNVIGSPTIARGQLEPVDQRVMAVRILFNLQQIHERRGDHAKALLACDRLCDLADAPFHLRDRGRHALTLGARAAARDDFERYLELAPGAEDVERVKEWLARAKATTLIPN
jgi:regulator of sirC expression with transglutaminase-like and TPR domain